MPPPQNRNTNLTDPRYRQYGQAPTPVRPRRRSWWPIFLSWAVLATVLALVFINRQAISDHIRLSGYQTPANVQQLADQDTMTDYARHMFYLNKPQLISSVASFRKSCPDSKDTVVLGCYHPGEQGIYIYDVKDPALNGIAQVTAAHEDLHAIYGRLSPKERSYVNGLLQNYYQHGLTDPQVKAEIELYKKNELNDVLDEMHSTFGTEVANLPPALEAYYSKYFKDRPAIIAYQRQYNQVFTSRQQAVAADDAQLAAMKQQIDSRQAAIEAQLKSINADKARLDSLRSAGNAGDYNAAVPAYNAEITSYNNAVNSLRSLIDRYNQLVVSRNQTASELNTLDKELDTRVVQTAN